MRTLSPEQAQRFLAAAVGDPLEALYVLALSSGMRQGELLGLHWRDVDLDDGVVRVTGSLARIKTGLTFGETKSGKTRQVALSGVAIDALRRHRVVQSKERLRLGEIWEDNDLVFANGVGRPIDARNVLSRSFHPVLERSGLPIIRFHDLRHTAATLLLGRGLHPKIVSEMLGHSQISVTLDLYSHVTPLMHRQAAEAMNAVLTATA
jgi:integrase